MICRRALNISFEDSISIHEALKYSVSIMIIKNWQLISFRKSCNIFSTKWMHTWKHTRKKTHTEKMIKKAWIFKAPPSLLTPSWLDVVKLKVSVPEKRTLDLGEQFGRFVQKVKKIYLILCGELPDQRCVCVCVVVCVG